MGELIWLASYPKSGNTWLRLFLDRLEHPDESRSINDIRDEGRAFRRLSFDHALGIDSTYLSQDEVEERFPSHLRWAAEHGLLGSWQKTHGAYVTNRLGEPLFDVSVTRGAVLIVRNPLDVTVSYAHHNGVSIERCIEIMEDPEHALLTGVRSDRLGERLGTWRAHVAGWLEVSAFPVHLMRYEDMVADPVPTFRAAARFVGLPSDEKAVAAALEKVRFSRLQEQEGREGFAEKSPRASSFFRKGQVGDWRNHLSAEQVARVVRRDAAVMTRLGYLDERGELTV